MHRIDGPGATVDNKFTEGDPVGGVQATVVTDDWLNDVQENIMAVLATAGIPPVKGNSGQLLASLIGRVLNTQIFSAAGASTYTPTSGTRKIRVRVIGGGGGGGCAATTSTNCAAGAGGSGGGYAEGIFTTGFAGLAVVVGAGGASAAAGANIGGNGGGSSFGSLLSATGGEGGRWWSAGYRPIVHRFRPCWSWYWRVD